MKRETVPALRKADIMASGQFQQMLAVSEFLSKSDMIPSHFRQKPANVFVALEFALRQNMSAFMVMQNLYVVHGRPGIEGKMVIALVNQNGKYDHEIEYAIERDSTGKITSCTAWTTRQGRKIEGPPVTAAMVAAEKWNQNQGSKWNTMPELMFRYRAATYFARVNCPEVLMGLQTSEEVVDTVEMVSEGTDFFVRVPGPEEEAAEPQVDTFQAMIQARGLEVALVEEFVALCAETYQKTADEIKGRAALGPDKFFEAFDKWATPEGEQGDKKPRKPRSDLGTTRKKQEEPMPTPAPAPEEAPTGGTEAQERPVGPITDETARRLDELLIGQEEAFMGVLNQYGVPTLEDLSEAQGLSAIDRLTT